MIMELVQLVMGLAFIIFLRLLAFRNRSTGLNVNSTKLVMILKWYKNYFIFIHLNNKKIQIYQKELLGIFLLNKK